MTDDFGINIGDIEALRAQRDGWRTIAMRSLQGDFGDIPPIELIIEDASGPLDKHDRTDELADELRRRTPFVTDVVVSTQRGISAGEGPTRHINAQLGRAAIMISRRADISDAFRFSMADFAASSPAGPFSLFSSREVSFELLLRYLDFVIVGYKFARKEAGLEAPGTPVRAPS